MEVRKYTGLSMGTPKDCYELKMTREEYEGLKAALEDAGVVLRWTSTDTKEYTCQVLNPWKEAAWVGRTMDDYKKTEKAAMETKEYYERW